MSPMLIPLVTGAEVTFWIGAPLAVLGALGAWTQAGRAMFDVVKNVYRARELSREPLPMIRSTREVSCTSSILRPSASEIRRPEP